MENNRQEDNKQDESKNPTLGQPGTKVADYGNVTGGSSNETLEQKHGKDSNRQGNSSIPLDEDDTIGNP